MKSWTRFKICSTYRARVIAKVLFGCTLWSRACLENALAPPAGQNGRVLRCSSVTYFAAIRFLVTPRPRPFWLAHTDQAILKTRPSVRLYPHRTSPLKSRALKRANSTTRTPTHTRCQRFEYQSNGWLPKMSTGCKSNHPQDKLSIYSKGLQRRRPPVPPTSPSRTPSLQ